MMGLNICLSCLAYILLEIVSVYRSDNVNSGGGKIFQPQINKKQKGICRNHEKAQPSIP